jgi:hypothetical protein
MWQTRCAINWTRAGRAQGFSVLADHRGLTAPWGEETAVAVVQAAAWEASDMTGKTATLKALQTASKGMLFPSESDRPIKAFTWTVDQAKNATTGSEAIANVKGIDAATIRCVSLDDFFKPATTLQPWQSEEEKAAAQRFQDLEKTLSENLQNVMACRVEGGTTIDVYVIGKDQDGNWSGVSTQLVET